MSGSPSPSVSSSDDEMLMVNDAENAELFAQITKSVELKTVVGVPITCPVELFMLSPGGICGSISQEMIVPPDVIGESDTAVTLTTSSRVDVSYARAMARSSVSSSGSQIPSLSMSDGKLVEFSGSVPHPSSAVSFHPSPSSSVSVISGIPSPSVSS